MDLRTQLVDGSEVEDAPRAVLSHLLPLSSLKRESAVGSGCGSDTGSDSGRIVSGRDSCGLLINEDTLVLGAVLSLGVPSLSKKGGEVVEGWTCRYSSLLRLSLYLSCVPEDRLLSLLSSLMRKGEQWPKILLKSFSHLHTVTTSSSSSNSNSSSSSSSSSSGSNSSDTAVRIGHSPSESPHTTEEGNGSRTARMVLQVPFLPLIAYDSQSSCKKTTKTNLLRHLYTISCDFFSFCFILCYRSSTPSLLKSWRVK